jgi:starch synthase
MVDAPSFFDRAGNPYLDQEGSPWQDNAVRFSLFARAVIAVSQDRSGLKWKPDILHCNDWQSALAPALLFRQSQRPVTVFTIHNLAYQGLFPYETFVALHLPASLWSYEALEFHRQLSFIKGGLAFSDYITTVSPNYAREIQTPAFGCGLEGLLSYRQARLTGILNGIDIQEWNPATDPNLARNYDLDHLQNKRFNKTTLQKKVKLPPNPEIPLIGLIGRLVHQKGIDLVLKALPELLKKPVQLVLLGSGDSRYEASLRVWSNLYPQQFSIRIGYDEELAHLIEAGADIFLMPSRFEPCGLNQMYSLRYGTLPVVRKTGGLADTVVDATAKNISDGTATGFTFLEPDSTAMLTALFRALSLYKNNTAWKTMQRRGMRQDLSWESSARKYLKLYQRLLQEHR